MISMSKTSQSGLHRGAVGVIDPPSNVDDGDLIGTAFTSSFNDAGQQAQLGASGSPTGLVPLSSVSQFEAKAVGIFPENGSNDSATGSSGIGPPSPSTALEANALALTSGWNGSFEQHPVTTGPLSTRYLHIVDIIPNSDSAESSENSEPSLGVDPLDPAQMIAGSFGVPTRYFKTTNGGMTSSDYGFLGLQDKSIAWKQDGSAALTATLHFSQTPGLNEINTYSGTTAGSDFGSPINTYDPGHLLDQPWMRTGPPDHVYVAYNDLSTSPKTASVLVSTNGGSTYTPVTVDRVGGAEGQDAPSVRLAVKGNTVYSVFTRWNSVLDTDAFGELRFNAQVVIVRSDNGGADGFAALGAGGNGVQVAAPTSWDTANSINGALTLGQERTSGELAIAVDPNNAQHVVVAYGNAPGATGSGQLQLVVTESTDGGQTWTQKFATSLSTRSAQPAVSILVNGDIGLLYDDYDPTSNKLSQHLLTTTNDFFTPVNRTLAIEDNATPVLQSLVYLGDFFDMTSVGNRFDGIFSASNADNGTSAQFFPNVTFQRDFTGTPGTASFQLTDTNGNPVPFSIDPFFFSYYLGSKPWLNDFNADGLSDLLWRQNGGTFTEWQSQSTGSGFTPNVYMNNSVDNTWHLRGTMDFDGAGRADLFWRNDNGTFTIWDSVGSSGFTPNSYVDSSVDPAWTLAALADFNGDNRGDLLWQNGTTFTEWQSTGTGFNANVYVGSVAAGWNLAATGDFNGDAKSDLIWQNGGTFTEWQSTGNRFNANVYVGSVDAGWSLAGVGDFTGSGMDDLVWFNNGTFTIWDSTGTGFTPNVFVGSVAPGWNLAGVGDYNGDGQSDLLWRNTNTGTFSIWDSTGTGFTPNVFVGNVGTDWTLVNSPTHTHA
jgi:hypothetical protein